MRYKSRDRTREPEKALKMREIHTQEFVSCEIVRVPEWFWFGADLFTSVTHEIFSPDVSVSHPSV